MCKELEWPVGTRLLVEIGVDADAGQLRLTRLDAKTNDGWSLRPLNYKHTDGYHDAMLVFSDRCLKQDILRLGHSKETMEATVQAGALYIQLPPERAKEQGWLLAPRAIEQKTRIERTK